MKLTFQTDMSSVKRRGGRPNRGGGQHNHGHSRGGGGGRGGRGGGGGGGSRKGDADWRLDTDISVEARVEAVTEAAGESKEKYKVEMQKLHMSDENQELIKAALLDIRGNLKLKQATSYRDFGRRLDHGYWLKDNQLLVRGVSNFSQNVSADDPEDSGAANVDSHSNSYGLQKLLGIGFHKSRCLSALSRTDGDVGAALEVIMTESFDLCYNSASDIDDCDAVGVGGR